MLGPCTQEAVKGHVELGYYYPTGARSNQHDLGKTQGLSKYAPPFSQEYIHFTL